MTTEELRSIVLAAGLECRIQKDEVTLKVCTVCGNERWNLQLNPIKGVYSCWACKAGGRLGVYLTELTGRLYDMPVQWGPQKSLGAPAKAADFKIASLIEVGSAAHYLSNRGLPVEVATRYEIGVCVQEGHQLYGRIVIPARDYWTGEVLGWVGRSYVGQRPKYLSLLSRRVVTGWRANDRWAPVVFVEGHLDGIAVHRAGFGAAVLSGLSAGDVIPFAERLPSQVPVIVMLDGSAITEATRLAWSLAPVRADIRLAVLKPEDDPASLATQMIQEIVAKAAMIS